MPLKTHKTAKKHPHHYAKVYWPYLPLIMFVIVGLWLGRPLVDRSQRGVLAYDTSVSSNGLLNNTNQTRLQQGRLAVTISTDLARAAQAKANDMVSRNYWSHLTPDGKTPWTFVDISGYQYQKAGENLAYGFATNEDVIKGWLNSPAHKQTMLDNDYREVGFGVASSPNYHNSGPETVVVALYGQPGGTPAVASSTTEKTTLAAFSTDNSLNHEASTSISKAQAITKGRMPWITFAIGLFGGIGLAYILVKNGVHLHRTIRKSERFVLKHPILDLTIVAFVVICGLLIQSVGSIR